MMIVIDWNLQSTAVQMHCLAARQVAAAPVLSCFAECEFRELFESVSNCNSELALQNWKIESSELVDPDVRSKQAAFATQNVKQTCSASVHPAGVREKTSAWVSRSFVEEWL